MNTSSEAIKTLEQARTNAEAAAQIINNLIAEHDYQDVALLVANAASALLTAATHLMQSDDVEAFVALERADDYLDSVYDIIDGETDEDDD
jgi:hypothetical protein